MINKHTLVLGDGGAKGFAHIGAVMVLEQEKLRPDVICGTSAGSIAGAFYALYADRIAELKNIEQTREFKILAELKMDTVEFEKDSQGFFLKTLSTIKKKFLLLRILRDNALVKREDVEPIFKNLFRDMRFEDLPITLIVSAFDLISGKDIYIKSGLLWKAILASCSIPGIFPPFEYDGMLLVDGGVTNRLPVKSAVLAGAGTIVVIDLAQPLTQIREMNSVVNLHLRTDEILTSRFDLYNKKMADLIIETELEDMRWNEFQKYRYAMEKGKEAIRENLSDIKKIRSRRYRYKKALTNLLTSHTTSASSIPAEEYLFI